MTVSRSIWLFGLLAACSTTPHPTVEHAAPAQQQPSLAAPPSPPPRAPRAIERTSADAGELTSELDKTLFALGMLIARNLAGFNLTPGELAIVQRGLAEEVTGGPLPVSLKEYGPRVNELRGARMKAQTAAELEKSAVFLEREAAEPNALELPSGVIYRRLAPGSGRSPREIDRVKVNYVGTLADGREFDSSLPKHAPAEFPLKGVIPCWTEGLQKMHVGERAVLVCPSAVAYGDNGRPPTIRGGAALRFEIELVEVVDGK